jgi:glycosyltransferase involved in cell wall biosynthesis
VMDRRLRIGIDARELAVGVRGGLQRYVEALVHSLAATEGKDHDVVFYVDRDCEMANGLSQPVAVCGPSNLAIREQFSLPKRLAADGVDIAHFPANTAPLRCPVPYVVTLHDTMCIERPYGDIAHSGTMHNKALSLYSKLAPIWAVRRARRVLTVSTYSAERISRVTGVPLERISVLPQALHPRFRPVRSPEFRSSILERTGSKRFAFVIGSPGEHKNLPRTLRAIAELIDDDPALGLVLTWPSRFDLDAWLDARGARLPANTLVMSDVTDEDLVLLYSNADVLVFVSTEEGFGLPIVEAMACGCPVVTSGTGCMPETAGGAALLADPWDEEDIRKVVSDCLADSEAALDRVEAGYRRVNELRCAQMGTRLLDVYARSVEGIHT